MEKEPIGIICAMRQELEALKQSLTDIQPIQILAREGYRGKLDGRDVLIVESGVGKVASGMIAAQLLDRFSCRPLMISGVAGGLDPELGIGDLVIGIRHIQHDYGHLTDRGLKPFKPGISPVGEAEREFVYVTPPSVVEKLMRGLNGVELPELSDAIVEGGRKPRLVFGTIVTGDQFINSEKKRQQLHSEFGAQAAEMEGGSAAQAAELFGTYLVNVRSMSDLAGTESHMDFPKFLEATAPVAANIVRRIATLL